MTTLQPEANEEFERFLAALAEGMAPAAGIALGFDRLLMLLCDINDINDCVAFDEGAI